MEFRLHGGQEWSRVVLSDLGHGHVEASITPYRTLSEVPEAWNVLRGCWEGELEPGYVPTERGEGDREANVKRACRRAKKAVRERAKGAGYDSLFTLTFRENVVDRDVAAEVLTRFLRRLRVLLPGVSYVSVFERQKRGAWHVHIATHRLPLHFHPKGVKVKSWSVLRAAWRAAAGDLGGNFDEQKRGRRASSFRIARYLSKYISKDFQESELERKRYWLGGDCIAPKRTVMLFPRGPFSKIDGDLLSMVFSDVLGDAVEYSHWLHPDGSVYWVAACRSPS
jgi:hypothetical protein